MTISPNSDEVQKRISLEQYYHTLILSIFLIIRLDICHYRKALSIHRNVFSDFIRVGNLLFAGHHLLWPAVLKQINSDVKVIDSNPLTAGHLPHLATRCTLLYISLIKGKIKYEFDG